jgi:regulator of protease activity HflC (stomatin/prohibitin superfamily)
MSTSFKNVTPTGPGGTATLLIVLSFTGFLLLTQSLFVVPSGQVAVVTTLGKVSGPSRRAGLNFKLPFIQSVYPFDIKTQVQPEKFETLTKDLQVIRATATVKYSVKPKEAGRIFATIASRNSDVYQKNCPTVFTKSPQISLFSI